MSAIATNPSAARRWSPPATSLQNRQSSRGPGKDPLPGHAVRENVDELADRRIDEPRRVVVAVSAPGPVDEDHVVCLGLPAREAELVRQRAQARAALLLLLRRNRIV